MKHYNYLIDLQYDGTSYSGWQRQTNCSNSIEVELEKALNTYITDTLHFNNDNRIHLSASGRTDAGVHARHQMITYISIVELPIDNMAAGCNRLLPDCIRINSIQLMPAGFHARLSAISKEYTYYIDNASIPSAFGRRFSTHIATPLDISSMTHAVDLLVGRHDFKAFASTMKDGRNTIKTIYNIEINICNIHHHDFIAINYCGDGFLYNMVRILTGTLIEIGLNKRTPSSILTALQTGSRQDTGYTVESKGLFLSKVNYDI